MMFSSEWALAACLAALFVPIAESFAVTVVPILSPKIIGIAVFRSISPEYAINWTIAIVADEL